LKRKIGKKTNEVAKKVSQKYLNSKIIEKSREKPKGLATNEIFTVSLQARARSKF